MIDSVIETLLAIIQYWPYYLVGLVYGILFLPSLLLSFFSVLIFLGIPIMMLVLVVANVISGGRLHFLMLRKERYSRLGDLLEGVGTNSGTMVRKIRDDITDFVIDRFPQRTVAIPLKAAIIHPLQEKWMNAAIQHYSQLIEAYGHIHMQMIRGMREGTLQGQSANPNQDEDTKIPIYLYLILPFVQFAFLTIWLTVEVLVGLLFALMAAVTLAVFVILMIVAHQIVSINLLNP